jgi:uncharacterized protein YigE (DUF2233 family)
MRQFGFVLFVFAFVLNFSSCGVSKLKEENAALTKEKKAADSTITEYLVKIRRDSTEKDSLSRLIAQISAKASQAADILKGDTTASMELLRTRIAELRARNKELSKEIERYKSVLKVLFAIEGNEAKRVVFKDQSFDCYVVNTKKGSVQFFWRDEAENKPFLSLKNLKNDLSKQGKQLVFASNAGMYMGNNSPQGLFIQNGAELAAIEKKKDAYGNFYLQPNGIFYIGADSLAHVVTTDYYVEEKPKAVRFATQSGPMLVINDIIHEKFTKGSENKNIRNGVGVIDSNHVVFVISNVPVNFYDFASLFKDEFKCKNALYLDGAISETYLPELARLQLGGNFGPMIGIFK